MERRIHSFLPNVKDYYVINDKGEVFSDNKGLMKPLILSGYEVVKFQQLDNSKKRYRVHRLVLMAFCPIKDMLTRQIRHKDGDKLNNFLNNLEWKKTEEELAAEIKDPKAIEREIITDYSKLTKRDIQLLLRLFKRGLTQKEIAERVFCTTSVVSQALIKNS